MAEPGLQKLPARHGDPAKSMFETADPDVPTTSLPLPSSRPSPKKKNMSVSDKNGKNICMISNVKGQVTVFLGDGQRMKIGDSASSNESESSSEEARKDQIASSSGESIGSQCSSQCPASSPIINITGEEVKEDGKTKKKKVTDLTSDYDFLQSKATKTKHEEEDSIVIDNTEEENKAAHRVTVNENKENEENGHVNHGCTYSGLSDSISGDSLSSAEEENKAAHRATVNENKENEENGHVNHGCTYSGSSDSISGDSLSSDLPKFTTQMGEQQFKPHKTESVNQATNEIKMLDNEDMSSVADSELFENPRRNSLYPTENVTEATIGKNMPTNNANRNYFDFQRSDSLHLDLEIHRKTKKYCRLRIFILTMIISGCISGVVAWISHNNNFLGLKDTPAAIKDDLPNFQDKCEKDISTATVGEQICIPHTQEFTSSPSSIHVRQVSSQYLGSLQLFSVNVSSETFVQQNGDWIVDFNSSRTDQQFRFVQEKATCDNIGIYEITIEYVDRNVTSFEFEIILEEPKLQQSVSRINNSIHVHCKMTNNCKTASLGLFVNNEDSSRLIPTMNDCSNPDKKSSSTISAEAIIPVSWFSGNQTISCVPLMTDPELAANLTSTMNIPVCEGDCVPNCKNDPHGIAYFQDKHICNIFYQCSNGDIILQNCSSSTYWSHIECTCVHFNDEICDGKTYRFFQPAMSFEKCTKA